MKMIIMKMMITVPTLITMLKTPMSMGLMLMLQTILSTILISMSSQSSWMPMIMFLMLIGGLLILFMYMSSIASNEKFKINMKMIIPLMIIMTISEDMLMEMNNETKLMEIMSKETMSMNMIFMEKYLMITIMTFMLLLITMISVVNIVKTHKGPLRAKTYE